MMRKQPNPENYCKTFPAQLRNLMKNKTQQELADYLEKTRQAVSYYLDGSSSPDWETIVQISDYFDVSTDYLLRGISDPKRQPTAADELGLSQAAIENIIKWKDPSFLGNALHKSSGERIASGLSSLVEKSAFILIAEDIQKLSDFITSERCALQNCLDAPDLQNRFLLTDQSAIETVVESAFSQACPEYSGRFKVFAGPHFVEAEITTIVRRFEKLVREVVQYDDYYNTAFPEI